MGLSPWETSFTHTHSINIKFTLTFTPGSWLVSDEFCLLVSVQPKCRLLLPEINTLLYTWNTHTHTELLTTPTPEWPHWVRRLKLLLLWAASGVRTSSSEPSDQLTEVTWDVDPHPAVWPRQEVNERDTEDWKQPLMDEWMILLLHSYYVLLQIKLHRETLK